MRCLVAGGAGFIGSHLCERLLSLEHEVICVDNLITGSEKNIHELNANPKFDFL
ncbi:MAG: NAD-dependent epimerase/dehydratase family protein, partial [bacterium]|nr:NAD-dependent epimerase/dehydratase family protein [bacterium]